MSYNFYLKFFDRLKFLRAATFNIFLIISHTISFKFLLNINN